MGLSFPEDLAAWRRAVDRQSPLRSARAWLRRHRPTTGLLSAGGDRPSVLVALDSSSPSNVAALLGPLAHLDPSRVVVLSQDDVRPLLPDGAWTTREWTAGAALPDVAAFLSAGHYLTLGAEAYAAAQERGVPYLVAQHGLLTPKNPPLARDSVLLAWSEQDADFWRSGRDDVSVRVTGSELLWRAAQSGHEADVDASAPPTYLGQLHGAELPRRDLAVAAQAFCRATGATYRPHPSERDRASRRQHAAWERAGIRVDRSGTPLSRLATPVVSVFSTGVLEAAAREIPAWVDFPSPPRWLEEFWERYGMGRWGSSATPPPDLPGTSPARLVADVIGELT